MATLQFEDGKVLEDFDAIAEAILPLGLVLARAPLDDNPKLRALLEYPSLSPVEKNEVLALLETQLQELTEGKSYGGLDIVALHNGMENLDELLDKFMKCHTHPDDEVRYIVDGEGVFGVVLPDGAQVELTVQAPDYICVPKGIEHWFRLTKTRRIKAVRIFMEGESWEADFTGTTVRF